MEENYPFTTTGMKGGKVFCEPVVRIYEECDDGTLDDLRDEYGLPQLGGTLPVPGDVIVAGYSSQKEDLHNPRVWILYEVVRRYFKPTFPSARDEEKGRRIQWVYLVVKRRSGREGEEGILLGG